MARPPAGFRPAQDLSFGKKFRSPAAGRHLRCPPSPGSCAGSRPGSQGPPKPRGPAAAGAELPWQEEPRRVEISLPGFWSPCLTQRTKERLKGGVNANSQHLHHNWALTTSTEREINPLFHLRRLRLTLLCPVKVPEAAWALSLSIETNAAGSELCKISVDKGYK